MKVYNELTIFYGNDLSKRTHSNQVKIIIDEETFSVPHDQETIKATGAIIIQSAILHKVLEGEKLSASIYINPESEIGMRSIVIL